jgi:release factor glutamine methyltransferase
MMDRYKIKENYITRDSDPKEWEEHANGNILKIYSNLIKGNVLDFGCNHGSCTFLICDNANVKSITGLDLNQDAINIANQTKEKYGNCDINFICSNILDVNFTQTYDTIVSFHTLEHIYPEDVNQVLTILYNSLSDNGYFIISIPYDHAYDDGFQHVAYYDEKSLSELFELNNFETIECIYDGRHRDGNLLTGVFKKTIKQ